MLRGALTWLVVLFLVLTFPLRGMGAVGIEPGPAAPQSSAVAGVQVTVLPNIAVNSLSPFVALTAIQKGAFSASFLWNVQANTEKVFFMLEASNLFKGDDASSAYKIDLDTTKTADLIAANANASPQSHGNILAWAGVGTPIPGNPIPYPTAKTEIAAWESSQNTDFSQNVTTTIYYKGPALELPQGDYSGKVRLTSFIVPPATP
jgi:hypothetical protein